MSQVVEELKTHLGQLSVADRVELASFLLKSLDDGLADESDPGWDVELDKRYEEVLDGSITGVPAQVAIEQFRRQYQ